MKRIILAILAVMLISTWAEATNYPLTITDSREKKVVILKEPRRIISLAPGNTEILFALGLESRIVGVTRYCTHPVEARRKTSVGDRTTSVPMVLSLKPDLVLAHGTINEQAIRSIESHGIKVVSIDPKTIAEIERDIRLVGRITNRQKQADKIAQKIANAKSSVQKKVAGAKTKPKTLVVIQGDPLWAAGPKTFVDEMIKIAGGTNVASNARPGFNQFSASAAVLRDPDVIIGTTRGDRRIFTRGIWKGTSAEKKGRVHEADADLLVRPGPRVAEGILLMGKLIHPDVFKNE